jgi:PAS domain S-box-containing protein
VRANERRNQALLENAPVAIAHNGLDGRFEYVNRAFCELVGYTADELWTKTWEEITHPDDVEADRSLCDRVLSGELSHYTLEKRYIRKDGSSAWVSLFGNFVLDDAGRPIQGVSMAMDITDRKRSDVALRETAERLLLAQGAARLGIYDWGIEDATVRWDDRTYELWGVDPSEPVTYDVFFNGVLPDDRPSTQAAMYRALDPTGDGCYSALYRVSRRADGQTRWIEATGRTRFENGRATRLVGTVQDVTDRKLAEEKLHLADRRKDEFLAMLAHELRNPLAPISNAAEVLARLLAPNDKARSMVAMIQRQGMNLARLLDDLLDVARITQGRISLRRESISLAACVDRAMETVQPLMGEQGHRVTLSKPDAPLNVDADKVRIEQCITNLLSNAAKYTNPGGQISVKLFCDASHAVIEVADNGIGISADFLPHVFDLFVQSDRSLDRSQGGLGIGLSICKQLIEMHGGTVSCASAGLGHGATFTLRLPRLAAATEPMSTQFHGTDSKRVLIVDDNRDAADSLATFLQLDGHQAQTSYSAMSALRQAAAFQPDIVLLDIGLPDLDGYEVARRLKASSPVARIFAVSGYGQVADKAQSVEAGCETHLTKPVDLGTLRLLLTSAARPNGGR